MLVCFRSRTIVRFYKNEFISFKISSDLLPRPSLLATVQGQILVLILSEVRNNTGLAMGK
jgi:hypothetical protein